MWIVSFQIQEEEYLLAELKKIEIRRKERERRQQDLQKLITAAESTTESRLVIQPNLYICCPHAGIYSVKHVVYQLCDDLEVNSINQKPWVSNAKRATLFPIQLQPTRVCHVSGKPMAYSRFLIFCADRIHVQVHDCLM